MLKTCIFCKTKPCEEQKRGILDICEYGVAYYNTGSTVLRKEAFVTLRNLSNNLRHEVNPILQLIIEEAGRLNPDVSTRIINTSDPSSRIVGAALIIDYLIQMITGVNDFHPSASPGPMGSSRIGLSLAIEKYFSIHGILKSARRAQTLNLKNCIDPRWIIPHHADVFEYIICILMDNAWKYSMSNSTVKVGIEKIDTKGNFNVAFQNLSAPIPSDIDIFAHGVKGNRESKGFGYGLHWAMVLIDHYNHSLRPPKAPDVALIHEQRKAEALKNIASQKFTILNLPLERQ